MRNHGSARYQANKYGDKMAFKHTATALGVLLLINSVQAQENQPAAAVADDMKKIQVEGSRTSVK